MTSTIEDHKKNLENLLKIENQSYFSNIKIEYERWDYFNSVIKTIHDTEDEYKYFQEVMEKFFKKVFPYSAISFQSQPDKLRYIMKTIVIFNTDNNQQQQTKGNEKTLWSSIITYYIYLGLFFSIIIISVYSYKHFDVAHFFNATTMKTTPKVVVTEPIGPKLNK